MLHVHSVDRGVHPIIENYLLKFKCCRCEGFNEIRMCLSDAYVESGCRKVWLELRCKSCHGSWMRWRKTYVRRFEDEGTVVHDGHFEPRHAWRAHANERPAHARTERIGDFGLELDGTDHADFVAHCCSREALVNITKRNGLAQVCCECSGCNVSKVVVDIPVRGTSGHTLATSTLLRRWAQIQDVEWVIKSPHAHFEQRKMSTAGMCGFWCLDYDGNYENTWIKPGIQHSIIDIFGNKEYAFLADTARIVMPHKNHTRLRETTRQDIIINVSSAGLGGTKTQVFNTSCGDISLRELLNLMFVPRSFAGPTVFPRCDARFVDSYEEAMTCDVIHDAFFHDHVEGAPANLILVLNISYGRHPPKQHADFCYPCTLAILVAPMEDDEVAQVYCNVEYLSSEAIAFINFAFRQSEIYVRFCAIADRSVDDIEIVDLTGDIPSRHSPALSDNEFKQWVEQVTRKQKAG